MRVESREHAGNGLGDELLVVDGLDVVALDAPEHLGERAQLVDRQRRRSARLRDRGQIERNHYAQHYAERENSQLPHFSTHVWPLK